jgi:predicted RNase H-like HicB family nuclease
MNFGVLFEKVQESGFPPDYYYAHVPTLGLTTHGPGIDGARAAALDLVRLWVAEKKSNGEALPASPEILFSTLDVTEDALQSA